MFVDPVELAAVKEGLDTNLANVGVGVLHEDSERIVLRSMDAIAHRNGHMGVVDELEWPPTKCKGFLVIKEAGRYHVINRSHLNGPQGAAGSLQMPADLFAAIVRRLTDAGL
jgi:hypothetical protein